MIKIKTLNKISPLGLDQLDLSRYSVSDDCDDPEAILVRSAEMKGTVLPPDLLAIARAGAGVNNIPIDDCTKNGVAVFNTPGANANAVKELVLAALFMSSRRIVPGAAWCQTLKGSGAEYAKKVEKGKSNFAGPEILGKTLGVIGLGAIGVLVANSAVALGMKVVGFDPYLSDAAADKLDKSIEITANIAELFAKSDYITLHAPLNDSTRDTISADALSACKDGVRVLNFARGELVNSDAIIEAVKSGKCACYATDFANDDQLGVDGILAIPHLGASTPESEDNCAVMAVKQVMDYIDNGNVVNSVNLPALSMARNGKARLTAISLADVEKAGADALNGAGVKVNASAGKGKRASSTLSLIPMILFPMPLSPRFAMSVELSPSASSGNSASAK